MACLVVVVFAAAARADERPADQILKDIDEVKLPTLDNSRRSDQNYIREYVKQRTESQKRKAELIGELYRAAPDNPRLAKLLPDRWTTMTPKEVTGEADEILARSKVEDLRKEALYWKARVVALNARGEPDAALKAVEEFEKIAPKDDRTASLLTILGSRLEDGSDRQKAIYRRVAEGYPDSPRAEMARGILRQFDAVGKPFELAFTDAITGSEVSIKALKGKVVVVDFWATWCGPCVAEMPTMKKLYAEYKDKGVEFIGVSLDQPKEQGGLDKLKEFVAKNEITWPQYYQGNFWQSEFSSSWGINAIPAVFVVDQEGKLFSVNARGKLETMIPELLKKAEAKAGASN
jgi:thiol-disulfide isomerase/thioredoxin